jgi:hypothetical protein
MKFVGNQKWCSEGLCPCPVRMFVERSFHCFSLEEVTKEVREREQKVIVCLRNLEMQDIVCRNGNLWCPDNP